MTPNEQQAFINAYENNIGIYSLSQVTNIVNRYANQQEFLHLEGAESVLDALLIWHQAAKYALTQEVTHG